MTLRKAFFGWMVAAALAAQGAAAQDAERRIYVTGVGEAQVVPDVATLTIGVTREEPSAREAMEGVAETMTELFTALDSLGIADEDRQTSNLTLRAVERNRGNSDGDDFKGFVARNMLTLTVRDVEALGAVIDGLSLSGANAIHGISFDVSEPDAHLTEARKAAVVDATAKAQTHAEAAGVTLGPVMSIRENQGGYRPVMRAARSEMAMDMPVAEGTVGLSVTVDMEFAIE